MVSINDPLFSSQWHFALLGNIQRIWDEFTGAGVQVGVYDDGVQSTHPDLAANYDASRHLRHGNITYDPAPITLTGANPDAHGTSVAGIIAAAANNGLGGTGVAFGASITGVNFLSDPRLQTEAMSHQALLHAASFDVMSNSWGYNPYFEPFQNASIAGSTAALVIADYHNAVVAGRGGLGTIIVQAAGNESSNAQADGINTARELISVAALLPDGSAQSYTNFGANILVAAGAAEVTTDLVGSAGYNTAIGTAGNYQTDFGGTSAATPVVSGVVALMLDANVGLGWRDVQEVLANSARMTGSVVGGSASYETTGTRFQDIDRLVSGVLTRGTDSWNDGGRAISWDYGFGRVDAYAAVRLAEVWTQISGAAHTSTNEQSLTVSNAADRNLVYTASRGLAQSAVTVSSHLQIEHIAVTVSLDFQTAAAANFVALKLVGPAGATFDIVGAGDLYNSDIRTSWTWEFGLTQALGLDAFGTWTVQMFDASGSAIGNSGSINNISVEFFGAAFDVNNIHHVTQDFLTAFTADGGGLRDKAISDTNGGQDWLQMATLAGNISVSLIAGANFSVAGVVWGRIAVGSVIENIVTGDGADIITGNALANRLMGMRGNDQIAGGDGNDNVSGGLGHDLLGGGNGNDTLDGGYGNDTITGSTGHDLLLGMAGKDMLVGGTGNDTLRGGIGFDTIGGGDGDDIVSGDGGADLLTGGAGADRFEFTSGFSLDRIVDFTDNIDTLVLDNALWGNLDYGVSQVIAAFAHAEGGTVTFYFGADQLTLTGVATVAALLDDLIIY